MSEERYLIVGLGNPGSKYISTRHNVGFTVIDALSKQWNAPLQHRKWDGLYCKTWLDGRVVYLLKPNNYMNRSGGPISSLVDYFKISVENILVVHDDLDMHPGRLKIVRGGGHGGHNGIRSIIQSLATKDFFRLKIGIGRPGKNEIHPDIPVERFVLTSLSGGEQQLFTARIPLLLEGIESFVLFGPSKTMNMINSVK